MEEENKVQLFKEVGKFIGSIFKLVSINGENYPDILERKFYHMVNVRSFPNREIELEYFSYNPETKVLYLNSLWVNVFEDSAGRILKRFEEESESRGELFVLPRLEGEKNWQADIVAQILISMDLKVNEIKI